MIPNTPRGSQTRSDAEALALQALAFLAEDPERLTRFMAETGVGPNELLGQAGEPATLSAVLDYLLGDESLLLVFAATAGCRPELVTSAQAILSHSGTGKGAP